MSPYLIPHVAAGLAAIAIWALLAAVGVSLLMLTAVWHDDTDKLLRKSIALMMVVFSVGITGAALLWSLAFLQAQLIR